MNKYIRKCRNKILKQSREDESCTLLRARIYMCTCVHMCMRMFQRAHAHGYTYIHIYV